MRKLGLAACVLGLVLAVMATQGASGVDDLSVSIQVSPHVLVLASKGVWVTVHTSIPYGSVNTDTVELNGVSAKQCFPDDCGDLVAKFDLDVMKDIVSPPEATLVLTGLTTDDLPFSGSETVKVVAGKK